MNFFKRAVSYNFILLCLSSPAFSVVGIHIAVMENPVGIEKTPFARRVQMFPPSQTQVDQEVRDHGVAVCSVLVGKNSQLSEDTAITVTPSLSHFSAYLDTIAPMDLVILNWSGSLGYPGMPEELEEELQELYDHFARILEMEEGEFRAQVQDYIKSYNKNLAQLPEDEIQISSILTYARDRLLELQTSSEKREGARAAYLAAMFEKIEAIKKYGIEQATLRFEKMKESLRDALLQHDNTLIVRPLGNEGECIDEDPHWIQLLSDELILSHTILVEGTYGSRKRHKRSNFTQVYREHTVDAPYSAFAWNNEFNGYLLSYGTSFSVPFITTEGFLKAQRMLTETGETPSYSLIKKTLLKE